MTVSVPVSYGEFFDRLTILELKVARITNPDKREIAEAALLEFQTLAASTVPDHSHVDAVIEELRQVNGLLWDIENEIRRLEEKQDFGAGFVAVARSVYQNNDRRADLKHQIDAALGSNLSDVKDYRRK